jgi:hypothetical protein
MPAVTNAVSKVAGTGGYLVRSSGKKNFKGRTLAAMPPSSEIAVVGFRKKLRTYPEQPSTCPF